MVKVVGIDLSGSHRRFSGFAVVDEFKLLYVTKLRSDEEIFKEVLNWNPRVVAIDSPFSHSSGYREVDRVMKKMGFRVLPPGWRGMRKLVDRCVRLKEDMVRKGIIVIETHPSSCLKSSGCLSYGNLFKKFNIDVAPSLSRDELDAVIAALVALMYTRGETINIKASDGEIHLLPTIC